MAESSFAGVWRTNFGRLELVVAGNRVTGRYEPLSGCVEGSVFGRILHGTWQQNADDQSGLSWGTMRLTVDSEDKKFRGKWWYSDHNAPAGGLWYGRRWEGTEEP